MEEAEWDRHRHGVSGRHASCTSRMSMCALQASRVVPSPAGEAISRRGLWISGREQGPLPFQVVPTGVALVAPQAARMGVRAAGMAFWALLGAGHSTLPAATPRPGARRSRFALAASFPSRQGPFQILRLTSSPPVAQPAPASDQHETATSNGSLEATRPTGIGDMLPSLASSPPRP